MGELSANFRANLRKFRNRVARVGRLVYSSSGRESPCFEEAYEDFLRVESSGWKGRYGIGGAMATNPSTIQRDFVHAVFFDENECNPQVHRLLLGGDCISALLTVRSGGTLVALKIGHDEAYRPLGPGHLMIDWLLRSCCQDHAIRQVDLLAQTRWMDVWRPIILPHHHFYLGLNRWQGFLGLALLQLPSVKHLLKRPAK
jgi:CelD/BcsL family acetyltransferase involved in cellulose biosynthesis